VRTGGGRRVERDALTFAVLLAVLFCNMVGMGAVFALLPDLQDEHHLPTAGLGLIGGASVLMAVIAQLTLARYADRGQTVRMLRSGIAAMIAGFAWMAVATDLWQFVGARALTGLGGGIFVPACRRVIVARDPARAGELLGRATAIEIAGFVLGPPLAVVLANAIGLSAPFVFAALLLLAVSAFVGSIPEPPVVSTIERGGVRDLLASPAVRAALLVGATVNLSVGAFEPIIAKQLHDLGTGDTGVAITLSLFGVPYVFLTSFGGRLADRHGPQRVALLALVASVPAVAGLGFARSAVAIAAIGVTRSVIDTVSTPAGITAMAKAGPPDRVATGQGLYGAVSYTMSGVAAIAAAPVYEAHGARTLWLVVSFAMVGLVAWSARLTRLARSDGPTVATAGPEPLTSA
jgi:predicted MFS family arabinose efflux permease